MEDDTMKENILIYCLKLHVIKIYINSSRIIITFRWRLESESLEMRFGHR